jgi:hypothetical protein
MFTIREREIGLHEDLISDTEPSDDSERCGLNEDEEVS